MNKKQALSAARKLYGESAFIEERQRFTTQAEKDELRAGMQEHKAKVRS